MDNYEEKISLLTEMISFSIVDGKLHKREYDFLWLIASDLQIQKPVFDGLFHSEEHPKVIKSEFERIRQFYRLALLMHCDGILHEKEEMLIAQLSLNMGLNPSATKRVLQFMKKSPDRTVDGEQLLAIFREQQN